MPRYRLSLCIPAVCYL